MLRILARILIPRFPRINDMFVHRSLNICGESLHQSSDSTSDCNSSVDFGTLFEASESLHPVRSEYSESSSSNDSIHQCYFTERTKHITSQSTCSNRTFCKKRRLELLEPDTNSPSVSVRAENLEDAERFELLSSKHLYAGREILNRWILIIVRITIYIT